MGDPVGNTERPELRKMTIIKGQDKMRAAFQCLNRMTVAFWEIPDVTLAKVGNF